MTSERHRRTSAAQPRGLVRRTVYPVLLSLVAGLLAVMMPAGQAQAADGGAYRTLSSATSGADWMSRVDAGTSLGRMSIPGTHDTLATKGGDAVQTQEGDSFQAGNLADQLNHGIRAIDIRVRVSGGKTDPDGRYIDGAFVVHHGVVYQDANFTDMLQKLGAFLDAHPAETVLLNLHAECTAETFSCTDDLKGSCTTNYPGHPCQDEPVMSCDKTCHQVGPTPVPCKVDPDNKRACQNYRENLLDWYRDHDPNGKHFWAPSVNRNQRADVPKLGDTRGKIVLMSFTGPFGGLYDSYGLTQPVLGDADSGNSADCGDNLDSSHRCYVQNHYDVPNLGAIASKRDFVRRHLDRTNTDPNLDRMYLNYTSGASAFAYPYNVAGGCGLPNCQGVNDFLLGYLNEDPNTHNPAIPVRRTGVVMMDFPGGGLIDKIVGYNPVAPVDPGKPGERIGYFTSWSIYGNGYFPKTMDTNGTADKLTTLMYSFENIDPVNLTCQQANKPGSNDDNNLNGNDGAGDAWADYQRGYTAAESIDGVEDTWAQPLKGNFNQLKKLKAKHPNLKVLATIGGWTYSKFFSDAAATDASRQKFVSSCVDMYIKGTLPQLTDNPAGGVGAAAGVFDGIDIDWEFPGATGRPGNHTGPQDTANYTALLGEFRRQLDALGGKHYQLTSALPSGPNDIAKIQAPQVAQYLDLANIMAYDMHGAWEGTGPTNFQAPLYDSPRNPGKGGKLTVNDAISAYTAAGLPANKITLGVPFYARGWTGVPDGGTHGLYQPATGASAAFPFSQAPGVAFYKELAAAGKMAGAYWDADAQNSWVYDGTNFYGVETPQAMTARRQFIKDKGLAGVMMFSLEGDDPASTLLNSATGFTS